MKKLNKHLENQIKENEIDLGGVSGNMANLLEAISTSYDNFEKNREILEKAMILSSEEIKNSYEKLAIQTELQRANKELKQFVSVASHDLRAPLRTIGSFAKLLTKKMDGKLDKDEEEFLNFINFGVQNMETLLNDLLTFAKIGAKTEEKEMVDFNMIMDVVQRNLNFAIGQSSAKIIVDNKLPSLVTYPSQVLQLFQNLISNSIKYRSEAPPQIIIRSDMVDCNSVISIKDNGEGMDPLQHDKAFEAFRRLTTQPNISGTGLGLSICKRIVNGWGGKIWFTSKVGEGTTFFFTVPATTTEKKVVEDNSQRSVTTFSRSTSSSGSSS